MSFLQSLSRPRRVGLCPLRLRASALLLHSFLLPYPRWQLAGSHRSCFRCSCAHTQSIDQFSFLLADLRVPCYDAQWTLFAYANVPLIILYPFGERARKLFTRSPA